VYVDLIPGYSDKMVYLATDPRGAEFYAKRQKEKDKDVGYVIFKVKIPDKKYLFPSETGLPRGPKTAATAFGTPATVSVKEIGEVAYMGRIPASHIEVLRSSPKWADLVKTLGDPSVTKLPKPGETDFSLRIAWSQVKSGGDNPMWMPYDKSFWGGRTEGFVVFVQPRGQILGRKIKEFRDWRWSDEFRSEKDYVDRFLLPELYKASLFPEKQLRATLKPLLDALESKIRFEGQADMYLDQRPDGSVKVKEY
jgi:hypothetical protein